MGLKRAAAALMAALAALLLSAQLCSALMLPEPPRPPQHAFEVRVEAEGEAFKTPGGLRRPARLSLAGAVEPVKAPLDPWAHMRGRGRASIRVGDVEYALDVSIQVSRWRIAVCGWSSEVRLSLSGWVSPDNSLALYGILVVNRPGGRPITVPEVWILHLRGVMSLAPIIRPL